MCVYVYVCIYVCVFLCTYIESTDPTVWGQEILKKIIYCNSEVAILLSKEVDSSKQLKSLSLFLRSMSGVTMVTASLDWAAAAISQHHAE